MGILGEKREEKLGTGTTVVKRANTKGPETGRHITREEGAASIKDVSSPQWCDK